MSGTRISYLLRKITIFFVICCCSLWSTQLALADGPPVQWEKTFGGIGIYEGYDVQQTADDGYIIAGYTDSFGATGCDVYLTKIDPNGTMQWQKSFGGNDNDLGFAVQQTIDGGYIIAGYTNSFGAGSSDVYLIKTEPNGTMQWQKTYGGSGTEYGSSVQQTSDGGYIITYWLGLFGGVSNDVYFIKTEPNGTMQWQKNFGGSDFDMGNSVQQTSDGGYVIAGRTYSFGAGGSDVYLIKTEPNGTMQWQNTFGGSENDWGWSVQQTSDGGYIIAGHTDSPGAGKDDVYLIKTDPNGNRQWEKTFGGSVGDYGYSVQQTTDGGYIIAGYTNSFGAGDYDVYLIKTDPNGSSEWEKTFGSISENYGYSCQQTSDGGYIIAGYSDSDSPGSIYEVYLIKLCSEGTLSGDLNCDGIVNYEDVDILVSQWLQPRSILYPPADIFGIGDGIVNFPDFSVIAGKWKEEYNPGNERPEVMITYPEDGARLMVGGVPPQTLITAEAEDSDGTVVRVEFFDDEMKLGEDTDGSYGWSYLWTEYSLGWHTLTAVAWDNEGLSGVSAPVTVEVWMPDPPPP